MINFRFHLISLVAVFLALGVGVAMGASFIDRATVESLRGRVDDLDAGYRARGEEMRALAEQLAEQDRQAEALAATGSEALDARLRGQPVVLVVPEGVPGDVLDGVRASLEAAEAQQAGTLRLLETTALTDEGTVRRVRDALGVRSGDVEALRARIVDDLGTALGLLGAGSASTIPTGAAITDAASARAYLATLQSLGLIALEAGEVAPEAAFPLAGPFRYVEVLGPEESVDTETVMVPLAEALSAQAPLTLTVTSVSPLRPAGEATTTTVPRGAAAGMADLRTSEAASRLSTVDDVGEPFGRIALVYAVAQQRDQRTVGHYGTGAEASAPFPTVPPG